MRATYSSGNGYTPHLLEIFPKNETNFVIQKLLSLLSLAMINKWWFKNFFNIKKIKQSIYNIWYDMNIWII